MNITGWLSNSVGRTHVSLSEVRDNLCNDNIDHLAYAPEREKYQAALMEQYKLYVEGTDRVRVRRAATNMVFLVLNSGTFVGLEILNPKLSEFGAVLVLAVVALLVQCGAWYWTIRFYRQIISAKYLVVGALEEHLPASPWFRAEWAAVGAGRDRSLYWPITRIERSVPLIFALSYVILLVVIVVKP